MYLVGVEEGGVLLAGFSSAGLSSLGGLSEGVCAAGAVEGLGVVVVLEEAPLVAVAADEEADAGAALG